MPLCFWATQTAVAAADLPTGAGRSQFTPYLPPHTAATAIQHVYRSYLRNKPYRLQLSVMKAAITAAVMAIFKANISTALAVALKHQHSAASRIQLAYQSYVRRVSLHNNPTIPMLFAHVSLRILHSRRPFDRAVKSAYRRYIRWTKTNIDATYIRDGLDALHQLCDKRHINMDVESELLRGAMDVLTRTYDTG